MNFYLLQWGTSLKQGIYNHVHEWSNSYVNFEMEAGAEVEVRITKLWGESIEKAVVHPAAAAQGGKIFKQDSSSSVPLMIRRLR